MARHLIDFLNPAFLKWLPLAALPVVFHFLNQHFPKEVRFPSIDLIREVMAGRKSWFRLRDLFFLLMRTLVLLFLLFAFLKPIWDRFQASDTSEEQRWVALLVDASFSMSHRGGVPFDGAVAEAQKVVDSLSPSDKVMLMVLHHQVERPFQDWTSDHLEVRTFLQQQEVGSGSGDPEAALSMLSLLEQPPTELFIFSDFQRSQWAALDLMALLHAPSVFMVNVAPETTANRVVQSVTLEGGRAQAGQSLTATVILHNGSPQTLEDHLEVRRGRDLLMRKAVRLESQSRSELKLELPPLEEGRHPLRFSLEEDALPEDNHFHAMVDVQAQEKVALLTDDPEHEGVFFLRKAIDPFGANRGPLSLLELEPAQRLDLPFSGLSKAVISRTKAWGDEDLQALGRWLLEGGQALYILDGEDDPTNLEGLVAVLNLDAPLRFGAWVRPEHMAEGAQQWAWADFESPLLSLFDGEKRSLLSRVESYRYRQISAGPNCRPLLKYRDQTPAMVEWDLGQGRLIFLNLGVDEIDSSLPRQALFPAWIHHLLRHLETQTQQRLGLSLQNPWRGTWWQEEAVDLRIELPMGGETLPVLHHGDRRVDIEFQPRQPGVHVLKSRQRSEGLAFNTPRRESELDYLNHGVLSGRLKGEGAQHMVKGADDYEAIAKGVPLLPWVLALCVLWVFLESLGLLWVSRERG